MLWSSFGGGMKIIFHSFFSISYSTHISKCIQFSFYCVYIPFFFTPTSTITMASTPFSSIFDGIFVKINIMVGNMNALFPHLIYDVSSTPKHLFSIFHHCSRNILSWKINILHLVHNFVFKLSLNLYLFVFICYVYVLYLFICTPLN